MFTLWQYVGGSPGGLIRTVLLLLLSGALPLLAGCAAPVQVADGETLIVGRTHYRLWGIEAPGLHQTCAEGWPAGERARRLLENLTAGHRVVCESRGLDPYRRSFGTCRADGRDLGAAMVDAGLAWADTRATSAYSRIEQEARDQQRGLHAHECEISAPLPQ